MPTARLGAPPVRDRSVASPISLASASSCCGPTVKPHCAIACAAVVEFVPSVAGPTFIAK
jgi:hypothetical protein